MPVDRKSSLTQTGDPFADRWKRKASDCGTGVFEMVACGSNVLPTDAAPCLTFSQAAHPTPVCDEFDITSQLSQAERNRLAAFCMIGSDGAGNPLCIEHSTGAVVLDHEDRFHTCQFVNTSVRQLAECLLAYMGERNADRFRVAVRTIDPAALAEKSFWWHEAALLDGLR